MLYGLSLMMLLYSSSQWAYLFKPHLMAINNSMIKQTCAKAKVDSATTESVEVSSMASDEIFLSDPVNFFFPHFIGLGIR